MNEQQMITQKGGLSIFTGYPIKKRLPFFICLLLLGIVAMLSYFSYTGMKDAALETGRERLNSLAGQLSSLFTQSSQALITTTRTSAGQPAVKNYLLSGGSQSRTEALAVLQKIRADTTSVFIELLDTTLTPVLQSGKEGVQLSISLDTLLKGRRTDTGFTKAGNIYLSGNSMFHPIIVTINDNNKPIGYLVRWRIIQATPKSLEQLSQLIGTKATLYFGNADGSLWTDLMKPIAKPPFDRHDISKVVTYTRQDAEEVIATTRPIANTSWLITIELSKQTLLAAAHNFLLRILFIGLLLVATGILVAWIMSRNVTRPLNTLTEAASAIAAGNYESFVEVRGKDELSKLALAFNVMAMRVTNARLDLEHKVQERTSQLMAVNAELEAFSYSVSHDLRAPLRAINGYATILKEDYGTKMDEEANRIMNAIVTNANIMGTLIDDLIAFSKISKQELNRRLVDMKMLAETCLNELLSSEKKKAYEVSINSLPPCEGDKSMIKQVWINLLSNALKYSSAQSRSCIEIGYEESSAMNVYFVKDNGVGFDMKYKNKLFGVFQRLHSREAFEGTGVGLALAKRIIAKHDGEIWAESSPGKGATFYFSLPKSNTI